MSRIDTAHAAVRAQPPFDIRRETRWQYDRRIAQAVLDALGQESGDPYADCRCGHGRSTHAHYTGACGLCDCAAVREAGDL